MSAPDDRFDFDARFSHLTGDALATELDAWVGELERARRGERRQTRAIAYGLRSFILERDNFRCRRCGAGPRDERLVVDHITPIALGGTSDEGNLQTLCEPCNIGKGARPPHAHDLGPCTA